MLDMTTLSLPPLSTQQSAVVDWVRNGKGSAFVEAVAGSGKTTTLIQLLAATRGSVAFAVYNKPVAEEIKAKIAKYIEKGLIPADLARRLRVGTFHSFGFGAIIRVYPKVVVSDSRKKLASENKEIAVENFLSFKFMADDDEWVQSMFPFVHKLVGFAKQRARGVYGATSDRSKWYEIVDHFDLAHEIRSPELIEFGVEMAIAALDEHVRLAPTLVDFDDMVYIPVVTGMKMWENDWFLGDEAQDTNPARRALARKMLRRDGRSVWVGDRHQAIYGFTGADSDAIDQIVTQFNCCSLPLTVTYRCPKSVVAEAQTVVSHIEAAPSAPEGEVIRTSYETFMSKYVDSSKPTDGILCRNTAPLVATAFSLIKRGVPCFVEGRDIGKSLLTLANRFSARSVDKLREKLEGYAERETQKLIAKGKETQAASLQDRVDTLLVVLSECKRPTELPQKVYNLFADTVSETGVKTVRKMVTLATVHRSKGREWPRVFVLGRDVYMPSRWARQAWQLEQESNLIYVAYTRTMETLVLISGEVPVKK